MSRLIQSGIMSTMREMPLFSAMDDSGLERLLGACPTRIFPAGSRVLSPLEWAENFYIILAGKVKIYQLSPKGDEQILHLYGPGHTFGEAAMWAGIRYPAYAEVLTETILLSITRKTLKNLIEGNAELAMAMLAGMSSKLREFNLLIEKLALKEVPARLAGVLLELSEQTGGNTIRLKQTKRELAAQR
ncbi:MAG: Crp/Fnr family transcriptional regulator [Phycisphaerae bacterium]|nr:Crp/Fnr family transcriptional regulator [Phycisphaerae bacterium]